MSFVSVVTDVNEDGSPAFTFEPWTDGHAVGFKVTRHVDGKVGYVCLNPSQDTASDDTFNPDVFVYTGTSGEVPSMSAHHYYNIDFGDAVAMCPYGNPACPTPDAPVGEGHHADCLDHGA